MFKSCVRQWHGLSVAAMGLLLSLLVPAVRAAEVTPPGSPIDIHADKYEVDLKTNTGYGKGHVVAKFQQATLTADEAEANLSTITARGHVRIEYQDMVLVANEIEVNATTRDVAARGGVGFQRGLIIWRGDQISGNLGTKEFRVGVFRATSGLMFMRGANGHHFTDGHTELGAAALSTCEYLKADHAHYSLHASRVIHYPNGSFRAYNVVYMVGPVPLFYLPVVWGNTDPKWGAGMEIKPGYSGSWGPYLLLSKTWPINGAVTTKMELDLRGKHGVAVGNQTKIHTDKVKTDVLAYGMVDNDTPTTNGDYNRRFDSVDNRYRVKLTHLQELRDDLTLRVKVDKLSDIDMLENWFRKEFRADPQPKSFLDVTLEQPTFALSLGARAQVNEFYTDVEQLPMLRLTIPRQQLSTSGIYYQSDSSVGYLAMRWREFDKARTDAAGNALDDAADYKAWRADTVQMFYYPLSLNGIEIVPRAGFRFTYYNRSSSKAITLDDFNAMIIADDPDSENSDVVFNNYDDDGGSVLRTTGEAGLELTTKYYRTWKEWQSTKWGIDGLRHVVQPYANYTFAPQPTEDRDHLYFFDELDRLIEQNFIRVGLKQRWETRRSNRIYTLATLENYADFHFQKEEDFDNLGNFGTRATYTPREDLKFWGSMLVDMGDAKFNRGQIGTSFGNAKVCRIDISYLYRNDYDGRTVYSMGSSLTDVGGDQVFARHYDESHYVTLGLAFPINALTDGRIQYEYDIVRNRLARQMYEISRNLHCWQGALRLEAEESDITLMLVLYLKAYPGFGFNTSL